MRFCSSDVLIQLTLHTHPTDYAEKYSDSQRLHSTTGNDDYDTEKSMTLTHRLDTTHEINAALRSQFETSSSHSSSITSFLSSQKPNQTSIAMAEPSTFVPRRSKSTISLRPTERVLESHAEVDEDGLDPESGDLGCGSTGCAPSRREGDGELDVTVRIEQTVSVERTRRRMREDYRTPRTIWDSRGIVSRSS